MKDRTIASLKKPKDVNSDSRLHWNKDSPQRDSAGQVEYAGVRSIDRRDTEGMDDADFSESVKRDYITTRKNKNLYEVPLGKRRLF